MFRIVWECRASSQGADCLCKQGLGVCRAEWFNKDSWGLHGGFVQITSFALQDFIGIRKP